MVYKIIVGLIACFIMGCVNAAAPADWVFANGKVYTVNAGQPWAQAVAVNGKEIVYVGDDAGAQEFVGTKTKVIDLKGRMLLPGFIESHIHPAMAWLTMGADLQTDDPQEVLRAAKQWADANPEAKLVRGFGWRYSVYPSTGPRKEDLDAIIPDRPVFLIAIDSHGAWVNSKALAMAGITKDSLDPQPPFSTFQRDPKTGEPTGFLVEGPAMLQVLAAIEPPDLKFIAHAMEQYMPKFAAAGITSVLDAGILGIPQPAGFEMYGDLERAGKLSVRVVGSYYYNNPDEDPLPLIRDLLSKYKSELVQASVLKINVDGGDPQYTAAMLDPYADRPGFKGELVIPLERLKAVVGQAHAEGISTHAHAFGDGAVRAYLDAVEAARAAHPESLARHTAAHSMYLDPADIPRFKKLDVTALFSAQWATPDPQNLKQSVERLGEEVVSTRFMRIRSVAEQKGRIAFGTDWPAAGYYSTYKPLEAIQVAITREMLSGKGLRPIMPPDDERISLDQALGANTMGAAYVLGMEGRVGSLQPGKLADLIVLEKSLFDVPPDAIQRVNVQFTMMNGKVTHRDGL